MAPAFSRLSSSPLPEDILRMIASLLSAADLKNLVVSCKACHFAGAPLLYRSVETWIDPIRFERTPYPTDNRPIEFLLTVVNSTLPGFALSLPSRCYATHLVTLCYGSWSVSSDVRALPLLAEALRFTHRLRHLRLDVPSETVPVLIDIFRRFSIIITPSTVLPDSSPVDRRSLPCLQSLRTSRIAIADALMQYRSIETVAVDLSIQYDVLAKFLRAAPPWNPTHLQQLSLHVAGYSISPGLLEGMLNAFPRLQHLAVRVNAARSPQFAKDALRALVNAPALGQSLQALSFNHGNYYPDYSPILGDLRALFAEGFPERPALREVVMGGSLWRRKTTFDKWSFKDFDKSYLEHWPWLQHRNEGKWARYGEAVRAYYRFT